MADLPSDTEGGTRRFGASIVIERLIGEVFPFAASPSHQNIWASGAADTEFLKLTSLAGRQRRQRHTDERRLAAAFPAAG